MYKKVVYGGYMFCTRDSQRQSPTDNSNIRMPFYELDQGRRVLKSAYGSIESIFTHELYPGGPKKLVLQVNWFEDRGLSPISMNPMVDTSITETGF